MLAKYGKATSRLLPKHLEALRAQKTTVKGNSFLHHFPLFVLPSWIHHTHPRALMCLLEIMSSSFKRLFYEGFTTPSGKHYCVAVTAAKGDLKWFRKIALERCWERQAFVRSQQCCHECLAGEDDKPFEDLSESPSWAPSAFVQRPWSTTPVCNETPFCPSAPEKQYKKDLFHLTKVGIYRDLSGSCLLWLVYKGYYGTHGTFDQKLHAAHSMFRLFCSTTGKVAALRSFTRTLFNFPRLNSFGWANTKGSDTMLILKFLIVQCSTFANTPLAPGHVRMLLLMTETCRAATEASSLLTRHNMWFSTRCAMNITAALTKFLNGYALLAAASVNDVFNGFSMKPKLHLVKHIQLEYHQNLEDLHEVFYNIMCQNCEGSEDFIGRVCRLSRRLDSRLLGERVLSCCLLKSAILHRRLKKLHKI